jgi:hypothetical protein
MSKSTVGQLREHAGSTELRRGLGAICVAQVVGLPCVEVGIRPLLSPCALCSFGMSVDSFADAIDEVRTLAVASSVESCCTAARIFGAAVSQTVGCRPSEK